jgi:hypothetical protein
MIQVGNDGMDQESYGLGGRLPRWQRELSEITCLSPNPSTAIRFNMVEALQ